MFLKRFIAGVVVIAVMQVVFGALAIEGPTRFVMTAVIAFITIVSLELWFAARTRRRSERAN